MDKRFAQQISTFASSLIVQDSVSLYLHGEPSEAMFDFIQILFDKNQLQQLYVGESRPLASGIHRTLPELEKRGIACTLICDSAAAHLFKYAPVDWLIMGSHKVAANGDVINSIGSYQLALLAQQSQIKTLIISHSDLIDYDLLDGEDADIEQGDIKEVLDTQNLAQPLTHCSIANPVHDMTPANLITVIAVENGLIFSPDAEAIKAQFA